MTSRDYDFTPNHPCLSIKPWMLLWKKRNLSQNGGSKKPNSVRRRLNRRRKKERDEAKQEAEVARLVAIAMGEAKARAKDDLTMV